MARTCKTFHLVAVAILWRHISGLVPLMSTIPESVWEKGTRSQELMWQKTSRAGLDVSRLTFYASHVKAFTWKFDRVVNISSVAFFLRVLPRSTTLFPAARSIRFEDDREWFTLLLSGRIFASPALEELYMNVCAYEAKLVFGQFNSLAPQLKSLYLTGPSGGATWPPPNFCDQVLGPLVTVRLLTFECHDFATIEGLLVLSRIPTLEHVRVRLDSSRQSSFSTLLLVGPYFPALKTFKLYAGRLDKVTLALLQAVNSPSLRRFELVVKARAHGHLSEEVLIAHMTALGRAPFSIALRELRLFLSLDERLDPRYTVGIQVLQPLFGCSNLAALQIFADTATLDVSTCQNIAEAFPYLERLTFTDEGTDQYAGALYARPRQAQRAAPLEGLAVLAKRCRRLVELSIPICVDYKEMPELPSAEDASTTIECGVMPLRLSNGRDYESRYAIEEYLRLLLPRRRV
ncbi:hypothetical protein DAEQUDRAFT_815046 [Daedalea quercina L-15889]|uniref:U-box domain-containing protein n=1 Tax=Daedalea quercina L-15889 TaxID=1314783 RepID=A0A165LEG8_9APHY|nr:hypothetical protein DAEQUDRAFT_815046 [Daedalea quercina L-15889]